MYVHSVKINIYNLYNVFLKEKANIKGEKYFETSQILTQSNKIIFKIKVGVTARGSIYY